MTEQHLMYLCIGHGHGRSVVLIQEMKIHEIPQTVGELDYSCLKSHKVLESARVIIG